VIRCDSLICHMAHGTAVHNCRLYRRVQALCGVTAPAMGDGLWTTGIHGLAKYLSFFEFPGQGVGDEPSQKNAKTALTAR
jgi:hypothetical protein